MKTFISGIKELECGMDESPIIKKTTSVIPAKTKTLKNGF
jgi:hypothetical protein